MRQLEDQKQYGAGRWRKHEHHGGISLEPKRSMKVHDLKKTRNR